MTLKKLFKTVLLVLVLAALPVLGLAQGSVTATGTVVDEGGEPIVGAGIFVKGTTVGTTSDFDGKFSLRDVKPGTTLVISALSFKSLEVPAAANLGRLVLAPDTMLLNELVVVGFGTQKKGNLTGSVATIDSKDLNLRPVTAASQALQGLDPSVYITYGSGSPEAGSSITIRGQLSVNSGSPLILVDGVEMSLRYVNPNDIESVTVLKDASASAIYGAKASAGVVLVTTKSGSKEGGKVKISFNTGTALVRTTTSTDFITNGYDHVRLNNEFFDRYPNGNRMTFSEEEMQKLYERRNQTMADIGASVRQSRGDLAKATAPWVEVGSDGFYRYYGNFDWYPFLFNVNRLQQDYNVSASGGNEKVNYYVAGRFYDQEGVFNSHVFGYNSYSTYSFRGNVSVALTPRLRYNGNFSFAETAYTYPGAQNYEQNTWSLIVNISPVFVPYNPDGSAVTRIRQFSSSNNITTHRLGQMLEHAGWNRRSADKFIIKNGFNYTILPGWTATASYALAFTHYNNTYRNSYYHNGEGPGYVPLITTIGDFYNESHYLTDEHTFEAFTNYEHTFGQHHNFAATAGTQYYQYGYRTVAVNSKNLEDASLYTLEAADPASYSLSQQIHKLKTLGVFGRINYDYKGKYLLEVSARADGSSRFEKGKRWAFFPSASAGWRISDEKFFDSIRPVVNNLKLRYSIGSLGNQQMSSYYPYYEVVTSGTAIGYTLDKGSRLTTASVSDPVSSGLTWETVTTNNIGLDIGLFDGRLSFTAEAYIRDTRNMLTTSLTLPSVYGAATPKENCADLRTRGYELYLTWKDSFRLGGKPFNYSVTGTLGDYITVITKYNNPNKLLSDQYEGRVLGEIWGYHIDGLFESDEQAAEYMANVDAHSVQGNIFNSANADEAFLRAGDVIYADIGGGPNGEPDGKISRGANTLDDHGDLKIIGNTRPRYLYSARADLAWNGFDFSIFFQGIGHCDWYPAGGDNSNTFWGPYCLTPTGLIHKDFESNCWSENNTGAYFPRRRGKQAHGGSALGQANDRYLQNVGYIRLKDLSFGYSIPLKSKVISKLRVGVSGENLWYWSPLKKYCKTVDPEMAISGSTFFANSGIGISYPKTWSFNVQLTF